MKTPIALGITLALTAPSLLASDLVPISMKLETDISQHHAPQNRDHHIDQTPRFLVQLEGEPISTHSGLESIQGSRTADNKLNFSNGAVRSYAAQLKAQRDSFASQAQAVGAKVEVEFDTLFNGISVKGKGLTKEKLLAMPGVKAVFDHALYHVNMDASRALIHAPEAWELVGGMSQAGKGIRVAIIDSGIRPEHPMFSGEGFTAPDAASLPNDDYCATVDESFCNDKLIVARYSTPTFAVAPDEHLSPLGYGGHGTHVAGTAVGNLINATYNGVDTEISGVAPGAYLMSYKALYAPAEDIYGGSGSNIMLMEALEMAVKDGADVINNSWGGGAGSNPAFSPYLEAFENAEAAGIVIVSAAGNDGGYGANTIGCPGCIEAGITVANTTHGRFFANGLSIGDLSDLVAIEGNGEARLGDLETDFVGMPLSSITVDLDNYEGCAPFPADSFKDKVAVISRGSCAFSDKAANATEAGATALVVYNNRPGQPFTMSISATIPAVMIDQADGEAVLTQISAAGEQGVELTLGKETKALVNPTYADNVAATSSRGPNGDSSFLKPDMAAPGTNILSAWSMDDPGSNGATFAAISGTSMASPHVAGAAALMKQQHPEWSAIDIKTALTSSTKASGLVKEDSITPADAFDIGAGRLEVADALNATVSFDKASLVNSACLKSCDFTFTINDKRDSSDETAVEYNVAAMLSGAAIEFSKDNVSLAGGESAEIQFKVDSSLMPQETWQFGHISINETQAHLPLVVFANSASGNHINVATTTATVADPVNTQLYFENLGFGSNDLLTLRTMLPANTELDADSVKLSVSGGIQTGFKVDAERNSIAWTGRLAAFDADLKLSAGGFGYGLKANGSAPRCNDGCDETSITLDLTASGLPGFKYIGREYTTITMSDNGLAIVGGGNPSGTFTNRQLPDSSSPNNILAPFWTDFDLYDGTDSDTGGGNMYYGVVGDGVNQWLVLEWADAQEYDSDTGNKYTFQIWLQLGEKEGVHFEYHSLDALPSNVTVGFEDISGANGVTLYHNGEGTAVAGGDMATVSGSEPGLVEIGFDFMVTSTDAATDDSITATEDMAVEFDPTENDLKGATQALEFSASTINKTQRAINQFNLASSDKLEASITSEPANGSVVKNDDGSFSYTPNADFTGKDSFNYSLKDDELAAGDATVSITVENVNDAPVVAESTTLSATEGQQAEFDLSGYVTDVDQDALTWNIEQTSGTEVSFSVEGNTLALSVPANSVGSSLVFAMTANDGTVDSNTGILTIAISESASAQSNSTSSGGLGYLLLAMAGLVLRRRLN